MRVLASLFYFTYFAAMGTLFPFLNLYFQQAGMTTGQIGVLAAVPPLTVLVAAPLWGGLADALGLHRRLLPLTVFGTALPALALTQADTFGLLALCVLAYAFFNAPIMPLADNASLAILGDRRDEYGWLRIWGAISYGVTAVAAGALADRLGVRAAFVAFAILMALTGLVALRLPAPPRLARQHYLSALRGLAANPRWLAFLGAVFLAGVSLAIYQNYLVIFMTGLGASAALYGLSIAAAGVSELPVYAFGQRLLRRLKPAGLLMVALAAFALRGLAYSLVADPAWAVAAQLLHGLSFSAMWIAAVVYAAQIAPRGLGASALAAMNAAQFGLAAATGALVGASLYALAGPAATFRVAGGLALAGLVLFAVAERGLGGRRPHMRLAPDLPGGHHMPITLETRQVAGIPVLTLIPEDPGPRPVVFFVPGYTGTKESGLSLGYRLARLGFYVVSFDPLLHGERYAPRLDHAHEPAEGGIYPPETGLDTGVTFLQVIHQCALDIRTLIDALADDPRADTANCGVTGPSMGGYASYLAFADIPELRAAVPMIGIPTFTERWLDLLDECAFSDEGWAAALRQVEAQTAAHTAFIRSIDPAERLRGAAPRALLMMNCDFDTDQPKLYAVRCYRDLEPHYRTCPEQLRLRIYPAAHVVTPDMERDAAEWLVQHLLQGG